MQLLVYDDLNLKSISYANLLIKFCNVSSIYQFIFHMEKVKVVECLRIYV